MICFNRDLKLKTFLKKSDLDGFVKSSNSRRANFGIMRRTYGTLNDYEMQHNAEVGLFTRPSDLTIDACHISPIRLYKHPLDAQNI